VAAHIAAGFAQAERGELIDGDAAVEQLRRRRAERLNPQDKAVAEAVTNTNAPFQLTPQAAEDLDTLWWFIAEDNRMPPKMLSGRFSTPAAV